MSQKQEIIHKQMIENFEFLGTPYAIVQTFIKYHNIITPERIWSQLFKIISFSGVIQLEKIIKQCLQNSQQSSLDAINGKLVLMGILGILVITWIRIGNIAKDSNELSKNQKIQVFLTIDSQNDQISKSIIVQIRSKEKLKKQQVCMDLYTLLAKLCKIHLFQLQLKQKQNKIYLKGKNFTFNGLSLPSTLYFSLGKHELNKKKITLSYQPQINYQAISLLNYVNFLKYFENMSILEIISLREFFDLYCRRMEQMLSQLEKKQQYYFMLSPRNILIIENKQLKQLDFYFNARSHVISISDKNKVPAEAEKFMYFDKSQFQHKKLLEMQLWSVSLSILAVLADWQSLQSFQRHYVDFERKGLAVRFIRKEIQKLQQNRDISTYFNINKLKTWLKLSQSYQNFKIKNIKQKQFSYNRQTSNGNQANRLDLIRNTNSSNSDSFPQQNMAYQSAEFNNLQFKDVSSVPNKTGKNASKQLSVNFPQKAVSEDGEWEKFLVKIKDIHNNQRNQIQNIFGIKMIQQEVHCYKQNLSKLKNAYLALGYHNVEYIQIRKKICPTCFLQGRVIKDHCEHQRCLDCYQSYFKQKFRHQNYQFLICPQSSCNQVVSQQIIQTIVQNQKSMHNQRQNFLTTLMKLYVQNREDPFLRRCPCSEKSSYFKINKNTLIFLCDQCINYLCVQCCKKFHGFVHCEQQQLKSGAFQFFIKGKLNEILYTSKSLNSKAKKTNQAGQFKIKNIKMIKQVIATLTACLAQAWALSTKKQKIAQNLLLTEKVITKFSCYLTTFYQLLPTIMTERQNEAGYLSQKMQFTIQKIKQLHELSRAIFYVSLK